MVGVILILLLLAALAPVQSLRFPVQIRRSTSPSSSSSSASSSSSTSLYLQAEGAAVGGSSFPPPSSSSASLSASSQSILALAKLFRRFSFISWWFQIILSVISGVILTFANTVRGTATFSFWGNGFAFSVIGVFVAFTNALWTWNMTRVARRVGAKKVEEARVVPILRGNTRFSITLSLVGMLVTLLAAETIVGKLSSKVLSTQAGLVPLVAQVGVQQIQALDIFLVQANTNVLLAHYCSLITCLFLDRQLDKIKIDL